MRDAVAVMLAFAVIVVLGGFVAFHLLYPTAEDGDKDQFIAFMDVISGLLGGLLVYVAGGGRGPPPPTNKNP